MMNKTALLIAVLAWPLSSWASDETSLGLGSVVIEAPRLKPTAKANVESPKSLDLDESPSPLDLGGQPGQLPMFTGRMGESVDRYARPVYRAAEAVSDRVYDFLRTYVVQSILPGRLSRGLERSPTEDSYQVYRRELSVKEARFARRLLESYPEAINSDGHYNLQQMAQWQSWVREEQVSVIVDAFRDALLERHQMERFGRFSGDYALDTNNWSPGFLTMAAILGGAFVYANGLHADAWAGDMRIGVDLRAGQRIAQGLSGGDVGRLGGLELGWRNKPVSLAAEWGLHEGRFVGERVGINYRLRY